MRLQLLGYPLGHSLSPAMHTAALEEVGLPEWTYAARPVHSADLREAVGQLREPKYAGANVTVPHKAAVMAYLDGLTPVAQAIGAVNTIVKQDGRLIGHNTDAAGFLADLNQHGVALTGRTVLILGAGGSARAVVAACASVGARLRVVARRLQAAADLQSLAPIQIFEWTELGLLRASESCAVVINTTPLGMAPGVEASPWMESVPFPPGAFVYDLVYNPAETRLVQQARAAGLETDTGLGMLVEQGALAFERWTGKPAPRGAMWRAAQHELMTADG